MRSERKVIRLERAGIVDADRTLVLEDRPARLLVEVRPEGAEGRDPAAGLEVSLQRIRLVLRQQPAVGKDQRHLRMITFPQSGVKGVLPTAVQGFRTVSRRATTALQTISVGTSPLRLSRDFRLMWLAAFPSGIAMGAVGLAVFVQLFELTGSAAAIGYLGLVSFTALALGCLAGSAVVDHVDRRSLLLLTQGAFGVSVSALLAGSLFGDPPVALLYVTSAFGSAVASLHFPTRSAMIPLAVADEQITNAMTLEVLVWNVTMILGPIVGGFVLARLGAAAVYAVGVSAHVVAILTQMSLHPRPVGQRRSGVRLGLGAIRAGFAYLRPRPVLKGLLLIDLIAMVFGMRRALFPILAREQFGRGPEVVGLLMAAIPAGALAVSATGGWLAHIRRQGLGVVVAMGVWGGSIAAFGLSGHHLWLALFLLAAAGGADIVAAILRGTIIQRVVPEFLRGRVWGINFVVLNGGPRLGDLAAGLTAAAWGATFSVVSGGLASLVGAALFVLVMPELARFRTHGPSEEAVPEVRIEA